MEKTTILEAYRNAFKKHFEWVARLNKQNYQYLETVLAQSEEDVVKAAQSENPATTFAKIREGLDPKNPTLKIVYDFAENFIDKK